MARFRRRAAGATLLELIIALVLLAVGLLPLLLAMNRITVDTYALGTRSEAQLLAGEKIDELKERGFLGVETDYLPPGADSATIDDGALPQKPYSRRTVIRYQKSAGTTGFVDATPADVPTDYLKIRTTVSWTVEGKPVTRAVSAMITREGSFE